MRVRVLPAALIAAVALLGGCTPAPVAPSAAAVAPPTAAAVDPRDVPGSALGADAVTGDVPDGQRLAVVMAADAGDQERAVRAEVEALAESHGGVVSVHADASSLDAVDAALVERPDVIVAIGPSVAGVVDLASASNLDRSFLVLGTQLAEPTGNVVAVVWPGADQRAVFAGEEPSFTRAQEFARAAVETGLAAFPSGLSGHVIALD